VKWSEVASQECSIARTLSVVGDSWTMLVIRELFNGSGRFNGLLDAVKAPPAILSERLASLERDDVIAKRPYSSRDDRFEYRLTPKGRDLYPVLISLMAWGDRWMTNGTAPVQLVHRSCGHHVTPTLTCPHCGDHVDPRDMQRHDNAAPASRPARGSCSSEHL
jgi:DNA-binding HxlR family transcriptional regulator